MFTLTKQLPNIDVPGQADAGIEITPEMIRAFKEARIELMRSPATINRDLSCLRQILGIAVKEELIQKSPFFGGRVEFLHEKGRERTLSFDEEREYLEDDAYQLAELVEINNGVHVSLDHGISSAGERVYWVRPCAISQTEELRRAMSSPKCP